MPGSKILDDEFKYFEDIKFVSVEVIKNDVVAAATEEVYCGLFMGILEKEATNQDNSKFLGIISSSTVINLFNVTEYNVLSINVLNDVTKHTVIYGSCNSDQKQALEDLSALAAALNKANRMCKNDHKEEIIDVDTYKDYENEILGKIETDQFGKSPSSNKTNTNNGSAATNTNNHNSYTKPAAIDNSPKVFKIRRKGKMPSFERIEAMKQKVMNLAGLEVKVAVLKCDMEEKSNKSIDNQEIDDYYERMYGGYMM